MPHRVNTEGDIGTAKVASDSYDVDNIFLTDEGWVYRHFKKADKSLFWDEIICAGEVDSSLTINGVANTPVGAIGDASPTFETVRGDGVQDIENAPGFGGGSTPPTINIGTITVSGAATASDNDTETYTATNSGNATGVSYSIASSDNNDSVSGMNVTFVGTGARTLTVTGTKSGATDSGSAQGTKAVTVS